MCIVAMENAKNKHLDQALGFMEKPARVIASKSAAVSSLGPVGMALEESRFIKFIRTFWNIISCDIVQPHT